ncbi:hypothetical protein GCM10027287_31000 [Bordetella muralis]|jgi:hypothetical protein
MHIHRLTSSRVPLAIMCALLVSCANTASEPAEVQGSSPPDYTYTAKDGDTVHVAPKPRLTIQSGEGERLNLPWFIRDAQNLVNE